MLYSPAKFNRLSIELGQLRKNYESLKKQNTDSFQKIVDLEKNIKALETEKEKNNSLESKMKTKEREMEQLRMDYNNSIAKTNADFLQKIEELEEKIKALEKKNDKGRKY